MFIVNPEGSFSAVFNLLLQNIPFLIFDGLFLMWGCYVLLRSIFQLISMLILNISVDAVIVDFKKKHHHDGERRYRPIYEYEYNSEIKRIESEESFPFPNGIGEKHRLWIGIDGKADRLRVVVAKIISGVLILSVVFLMVYCQTRDVFPFSIKIMDRIFD